MCCTLQSAPGFQLTGRGYTFQGITIRNATRTGGSGGGCISLTPSAASSLLSARLNLWDTHFRLCVSAAADGGAIAAPTSALLYVWGSSFVANGVQATAPAAVVGGGAIAQRVPASQVAAATDVGALSSITIVNSYFAGNALQGSGSGEGGAVLGVQSTVRVARSTFLANAATGRGGAVHCEAPVSGVVSACEFSDNSSGGVGGAVSLLNGAGAGASRVSDGSVFARNRAELQGGAVYSEGCALSVSDVLMDSNSALSGASAAGAGLYASGQQPYVMLSLFISMSLSISLVALLTSLIAVCLRITGCW